MDAQGRLPVLERESLRITDVCVISVLWSIEFLNTWISSLCEYTSFVFLTSEELKSTKFEKNELAIFIVQCLGAVVVAFLVDINRFQKMPVIMIGFGLFAMTIFIALGTTMSNSIWPGMIMFWPSSALFITLPVTYCLMFNQKLNASVTSVRRLVSVLEMGNALVGWICFLAIPGEVDENSRYSVIFMWVVTIPLFVLFFSWLLSINKYVRGDFTVDTSVKSVVIGIRSDYRNKEHTGRSLRHIVLFILLLIPAMSLSILGSTLDATSEDVEAPQDPRLVNLLFAFQILIIPLIEVALATTQMREDRADYSILVIAHVTNVLILVLMLTNIKAVPAVTTASDVEPSHQVRIKRGEASDAKRFFCPDPGRITFIMLNGIMYDVEVISSVHFKDTPEIWSIKPGDYVPVNFPVETTKTMSAEVEILIADKSIPKPPEVKGTLDLQVNYFSMMYTYGNASYFSLRQYDNPYKFMKGMARVMYFSTLWLDVPGGTIIISSDDGSYSVKIPVPPKNQMESKFFPVARRMAFTYQFEGDDETAKKILTKDTVEVPLEEFDDYVVYVSDSGSGLSINSLRVCDKPSPVTRTTTTTTTLRPIEAEEQTAYALAGSSLGVTSVAYTHFFWVESPVRLRATLFAMFRVADAVVYRLTPVVAGKEISLTKLYALIALQVTTTIAHLIMGWIFQSYISHSLLSTSPR